MILKMEEITDKIYTKKTWRIKYEIIPSNRY